MATDRVSEEEIRELERLEQAATEAPWGWESGGEKQNDAFIGIFLASNDNAQLGGHIEVERYDKQSRRYEEVAVRDELIAENVGNANYADFALIAAARNALPRLLRERAEMREALLAVQREVSISSPLEDRIRALLGEEAKRGK